MMNKVYSLGSFSSKTYTTKERNESKSSSYSNVISGVVFGVRSGVDASLVARCQH